MRTRLRLVVTEETVLEAVGGGVGAKPDSQQRFVEAAPRENAKTLAVEADGGAFARNVVEQHHVMVMDTSPERDESMNFGGERATDGRRIVSAETRFPGRDEVSVTYAT
jgi:hypothetical protein